MIGFGQWSNYYNAYQNINVSGYVTSNQNITTIDYGKLALANAEKEMRWMELDEMQ